MQSRRNIDAASAALFERALKVMPGGSTRSTIFVPPFPPYAAEGKGAYVTDIDGQRYLDFANNFFSLIHGHAHPAVVEVIRCQAARGASFGLPTEAEVRLAEHLAARSPILQSIRFANTGGEAVMIAIKGARAYSGRPGIAKIEGGYHGAYDHVEVSLDSSPANWGEGAPAANAYAKGTPPSVLADTLVLPFNDATTTAALLEANASRIGAVIFDPLPYRVGLVPATAEFLRALRETTRRFNMVLIADEIICFRLHHGGAHALFGYEPDMVTLGKIIGGGLPVGAVAGKREIMEVYNSRAGKAAVPHGGTFTANPITLAAGLASMELLTPDAYGRLNALGERLRRGVRDVIAETGIKAQVAGLGSLFRIHMTDRPIRDYRSAYPRSDEAERTKSLYGYCRDNGILLTSTGAGALSTPMDEREIDRFVDVFRDWAKDRHRA
jgi:glutamate-1-semialdehyde 2,1-aminomutase